MHFLSSAPIARAAIWRWRCETELDEPERPIGKDLAHERGRDVVDGNVRAGTALRSTVVRVAVEHRADGKARDRIFEAAASEERIDVARLAFDGALDRRVVQQHDQT